MTQEETGEMTVTDELGVMETVLMKGDLDKLTPQERVNYYGATCRSLGLNPLTKPFEYIKLKGRLRLYATKGATEQLRGKHNISIQITDKQTIQGIYVVSARGSTPSGRQDESTGAVSITNLKGDDLANALMKAETKAKRRVTLSLVGLGWMDESEVSSVPGEIGTVNVETGVIDEAKAQATLALPAISDKVPDPILEQKAAGIPRQEDDFVAAVQDALPQAEVVEHPMAEIEQLSVELREYLEGELQLAGDDLEGLMKQWAEGEMTRERLEKAKAAIGKRFEGKVKP